MDFKFRRGATGDYGWLEVWILSFGGGLRGTTVGLRCVFYVSAGDCGDNGWPEVMILSFGGGLRGTTAGLSCGFQVSAGGYGGSRLA